MISITSVSVSGEEAGIISNFTFVPFGPLIRFTTSSIRQPITSVNSLSFSCPTATILSSASRVSDFSAGPPGTRDEIEV